MNRIVILAFAALLSPVVRAAVWHVAPAPTGSDAADGSATTPFATVNKAIQSASSGDEIRVAGGLYAEAVSLDRNANNEALSDVKLFGSCDPSDGWASKPGGVRSMVKPPANTSPCVYVRGGGSNLVQALTLTGGKYGVQAPNIPNHRFVQLIVTNNASSGFLVTPDSNSPGGTTVFADSYIAGNQHGIEMNLNWGGTRKALLCNCTVVDNRGCGLNLTYQSVTLRNTIVARNGEYGIRRQYSHDVVCRDSCVFGNILGDLWVNSDDYGSQQSFSDMRGAMLFDPKLDTAGHLTAVSPVLKRGTDPSDEPAYAGAGADVFGNSWNGSYDPGCFKSAYPIVAATVRDDVYVSVDGDDANDGSAAHPVRTVARGVYLTATNGTCHVGAGVFTGPAVFSRDGVTLTGVGRDGTTVRAPNCVCLTVKAQDVTVAALGVRDSSDGIYVGGDTLSKYFTASNVLLKVNCHGLIKYNDGGGMASGWATVTHCVLEGNGYGVRNGKFYADDSLFVDNRIHGIYGEAAHHIVNCTFVGNGLGSGSGASSAGVCPNWQGALVWNCVFVGNRSGIASYGDATRNKVVSSVFYGNNEDFHPMQASAGMSTTNCLFENPLLTADYRLGNGSPAINAGTNVNAIAAAGITVTDDLDGKARDAAQWDIGCYAADVITDGALTVTADLGEIGSPTPAYGIQHPTVGASLSFSAPSGEFAVSDALHARFVGWRLESYDSETKAWSAVASGETLTHTFTYGGGAALRFVWLLVRLFPVILSSDEPSVTSFTINGSAASVGANWIDEGPCALSVAVTSSDYTFSTWTGDLAGVGDPTLSTISFDLTVLRRIGCALKGAYHVAVTGGSDSGDGSAGTPWKTISHALASAAEGDVILVQGDLYETGIVNTSKNGIILRGGYDDTWHQTPGVTPTVIRPSDGGDCLYLEGATGCTFDGFVLTGGNRGVYLRNGGSHVLTRVVITNNASHAVYCDTVDTVTETFTLVSSLVADNGGYAYYDYDWREKRPCEFLNCTIVSNALGGICCLGNGSTLKVRNTVIEGNGKTAVTVGGAIGLIFSSCLHGSSECATDPRNNYTIGLRGNTFQLDPRLNADFTLSADSPCLKRGEDLSAYAISVATDVFGNPWNGVYDMGCFKSTHTKAYAETFVDTYVAADGDDANTGDDPSRAVRSVAMGLLRTSANGTCHVGPGLFVGMAVISQPGVTLVGAGRDMTVLAPTTNVVRKGTAISLSAANATVSHLCASNGSYGVHAACGLLAPNAHVTDARLTSNAGAGFYVYNESSDYASSSTTVVERTVFDCNDTYGSYGLRVYDGLLATSDCLFRHNYYGLNTGERAFCCVHSTFVSNTYGFSCQWSATYRRLYNCIFLNNTTALYLKGSSNLELLNSIFHGNTTEVSLLSNATFDDSGVIRADPRLETEGPYPYRPAAASPAIGGGLDLFNLPTATIVPTSDLYGNPRSRRRWDIGCVSRSLDGLQLIVR